MNTVFLVLLTVAFLAGAFVGAIAVVFGYRLAPRVVEAGRRARKPRPPKCYVVETTNYEEKPQRPRKPKHPLDEDEASGPMEPVTGVDLAV
jgi:hypothetical protein